MREIWLRTNHRILFLGMILPVTLIVVGVILGMNALADLGTWGRCCGWITVGVGLILLLLIGVQLTQPRLAYAKGQLQVYLRGGGPIAVPVQLVQCFFLASGAGQMAGPTGRETPLRNLTLRLDEKATEFHHRDVKPALGRWDDGYIVVHGAWCEPLRLDLVQRLNARLAEVQQAANSRPQAGKQQAE
jgi:hypothetical protein